MSVKKNLDYIIVLGAHVDGTRMTLALLERARRALLYLEENRVRRQCSPEEKAMEKTFPRQRPCIATLPVTE